MRLLLFSGGVESTCLSLMTKPDILLTIDYGQAPAGGEKRAAKHIATLLGMNHEIVTVPIGHLGTGDLTGQPNEQNSSGVPEHWPYRNQFLITMAAMAFADRDLSEIIIGTVSSDDVHSDGTTDFLEAMSCVLSAQDENLKLSAPAVRMTTKELVIASEISRDLLGWTFSCHRAAFACGACRGCRKTIQLFDEI